MSRSIDVAIIGGGIVGTATATFLAEAGLTVRLYERTSIAAAASGRNSGVVQHPLDPVMAALYRSSLTEYRRLADGAGDGSIGLADEAAGLLLVGRDPRAARAIAAEWTAAHPAAMAEVVGGSDLTRLEPDLAPDLVACRL